MYTLICVYTPDRWAHQFARTLSVNNCIHLHTCMYVYTSKYVTPDRWAHQFTLTLPIRICIYLHMYTYVNTYLYVYALDLH